MQITRETDYAIRGIYFLAERAGETLSISQISEGTGVPTDFLAKILQKLAKSGIVKSHRGVKGGFGLAKQPSQITFLDAMEAIEGPVAMNVCALDQKLCSLSDSCVIHPVWVDVRKEMRKLLAKRNFGQVLKAQKIDIGCLQKIEPERPPKTKSANKR